jgi:hypothetical protein
MGREGAAAAEPEPEPILRSASKSCSGEDRQALVNVGRSHGEL